MTAMLLLASSAVLPSSRRCFVQAFGGGASTLLSRPLLTTRPRSSLSSSSEADDTFNALPLASLYAPSFSKFQLAETPADKMELAAEQRLVCVGDVHGDYHALVEFLKIAGVYDDESGKWIGGDTILVQCGDVLDRGTQELNCWSLLTQLSQQALAQNGKVIILYGNHEALNAAGLFQYTSGDGEYEQSIGKFVDTQQDSNRWRLQFGGNQPSRWAAYEPGGLLASPLLKNLKVAVQVGKTVCVHAGLTQAHLDEYGGLSGMNALARNWIKEAHHEKNNNMGIYENVEQVIEDAQARAKSASKTLPACLGGGIGATSPVWMREYSSPANAEPSSPKSLELITEVLSSLQADRLVMGHTVQSQINVALQEKAWRIDVGASRGVACGTPEVLQVVKNGRGEEVVSVLTKHGEIPARERSVGQESLATFL